MDVSLYYSILGIFLAVAPLFLALVKSHHKIKESQEIITKLKIQNDQSQEEATKSKQEAEEYKTKYLELQRKITKKRQIISPGIAHTFNDPDLDKIR